MHARGRPRTEYLSDAGSVTTVQNALMAEGAIVELIAPRLGSVKDKAGNELAPKKSFLTAASVLYDAVYVPGGLNSVATLAANVIHTDQKTLVKTLVAAIAQHRFWTREKARKLVP